MSYYTSPARLVYEDTPRDPANGILSMRDAIDWDAIEAENAKYARELRKGVDECMRVLKPHGTLIFKWSECRITTRDVINAIGRDPLFGHKSGVRSNTHWLAFMKL